MVRKQINVDAATIQDLRRSSIPEVVRIRTTSLEEATKESESNSAVTTQTTTEVIRHGLSEAEAENTPSGEAEVVRYQQRPLEVTTTAEPEIKVAASKQPPTHQV